MAPSLTIASGIRSPPFQSVISFCLKPLVKRFLTLGTGLGAACAAGTACGSRTCAGEETAAEVSCVVSAVLGIVPDETRGGIDLKGINGGAGIHGGAGTSACDSEGGDVLERVDVLRLPCVVLLFFAPAGSPSATASADAALASESLEVAEAVATATVVLVELKLRSRT